MEASNPTEAKENLSNNFFFKRKYFDRDLSTLNGFSISTESQFGEAKTWVLEKRSHKVALQFRCGKEMN